MMPKYMTGGAAGMDLQAAVGGTIAPLDWMVVPTGIALEIPYGYEGQVRPRSGLAAKHGVTVLNAPGTIDPDYRGEVGVILMNMNRDAPFTFKQGDRIAQIVFTPAARAELELVEALYETARGEGAYGSTGV